ncbi:MAG: hypothetical protein IT424_08295 [Pirellulales bacterium]|nr:hypothetical protein [Pirellulales bacterium]
MLGRALLSLLIVLGGAAGCSRGTARVEAPKWDPDGFADAVLAKLDANGDASLDQQELAAAPGLAAGGKIIDADGNGRLSRDELVSRFKTYSDMRLGSISKEVVLSYNNRPLSAGKVRLVPEFFLEGVVEPAEGDILPDGTASPAVAGGAAASLRPGYYRVVVDAPQAKIPLKYASPESTPLGIEVVPYSPDSAASGSIRLSLTK